jgi:DNA-binding NtrC family response regulator
VRKFSILWETERKLIMETLELFSYNHTKTAECLGISDRTVRSKLSQYRALGYFIPNNPLYEKKSRKKENDK